MKRNIVIGILLFVAFISLENTKLQVLEALILLSILIFTPMLMLLVDKRKRDGSKLRLAKCIDVLYPIAAFCAALTFITDVYVFAVVWLLFTGLVAVYGSSRLIERGWKPLAESAIDSSFIYLFLGGFWFFAAAAHIPIMNFSYQLILLTAIHFHYSALIIPAITGFLGRKALRYRKLYSFVALSIMLSPLLIALGIAYSTVIEFIAVLAYLLAFFVYGFLVLTVPFTRKIAKMLVSFSAIVLLCTLTFSLIYAYGRVSSTLTLSINQMIWIHGVVNALGVVLPALVGWLIESTAPVTISYGLPMSRIVGDAVVGSAFLQSKNLVEERRYDGLIDDMAELDSPTFEAEQLSKIIRDFYEHTDQYSMKANIRWAGWFKPFAGIYDKISGHMQQLHLGITPGWQTMRGSIIAVKSDDDGRKRVRAWIRLNEQDEAIFVALYSTHQYAGETYMNIALPLPHANMTGILKPSNAGSDLVLSSVTRHTRRGDEGIYLHTRWMTSRLPLTEMFLIQESGDGNITANHTMRIFGIRFLAISYQIEKH